MKTFTAGTASRISSRSCILGIGPSISLLLYVGDATLAEAEAITEKSLSGNDEMCRQYVLKICIARI